MRGFLTDGEYADSVLHEMQLAVAGDATRAVKISQLASSWFERLLYISITLVRPKETTEEAPQTEEQIESKAITFRALKMKDMLHMHETRDRLGRDRIYLLRLMIGPLHGINLRNLLWHGFVAPHEFPPYHSGLLLGLLLSIAVEWQPVTSTVNYQETLQANTSSLNFFNPHLLRTSDVLRNAQGEDNTEYILNLCREQRSSIIDAFKRSNFVQRGFLPLWTHGLDMILQERYFDGMMVIFPLIESSLRRLYVEANNIQSFRLTAEPDTLCLSLDIILDEWLDREYYIQDRRVKRRQKVQAMANQEAQAAKSAESDAKPSASPVPPPETDDDEEDVEMEIEGKLPNKIFQVLGEGGSAMVFDLLIWADTLEIRRHYRARDQLAHGCTRPLMVSRVNGIHLLLSCLSMILDKSPPLDTKQTTSKILDLASQFGRGYTSCLHKKRVVIDKYMTMTQEMSTWKTRCDAIIRPLTAELLERGIAKEKKKEDFVYEERALRVHAELLQLKARFEEAIARQPEKAFISRDALHLFPVKSPITFSCLMQLVHVSITLSAIKEFIENLYNRTIVHRDMVEARTAWIDQRRNFAGMLACLPVFGVGIQIFLLIIKEMLMQEDLARSVLFARKGSLNQDLSTFMWSIVNRMNSLVMAGKYRRAQEVLESALASFPLKEDATSLAKNEPMRLWIDVEAYLQRLDRQAKGEYLEVYLVFEKIANHQKEKEARTNEIKNKDERNDSPLRRADYELFLLQHSLGHLILPPM